MKLETMTETAIKAALDAGKAILDVYALDFEVETKADNSPLTAADKASHAIIVEALEKTPFPVLSEESAEVSYEERRGWTTYWLVDPLDGTKEFIKKNGEFTVNIALVEKGIPVMGIVYVPVLEVLYFGMSNLEGSTTAWKSTDCSAKSYDEILRSREPISTSSFSQSTQDRPLRVVASKSHCNDETRKFIADLEALHGEAELVSRGSSLKLCMVAEGSADIYPRIAPTMEWDTAAAHAVVTAAGGVVCEFDSSLPVEAYTSARPDAEAEETAGSVAQALRYNKENLLNPYFIVSGLGKKW